MGRFFIESSHPSLVRYVFLICKQFSKESWNLSLMKNLQSSINYWEKCNVGITGANGALGKALTKKFRKKGAVVIGLTHSSIKNKKFSSEGPQKWVQWQCGQEEDLKSTLSNLDILVLNHGIYPKGLQSSSALNDAIEINALSTWRLMEIFEELVLQKKDQRHTCEIWINTSEAEIQPAFSPGYELSKRLIGQLVSLKWNNLDDDQKKYLKIRKLILGPFLSELNPLGLMKAEFVANQIISQAELKLNLIIVTPNPLTYLLIPLSELTRSLYFFITKKFYK